MIRKIFFWSHLVAGVLTGLVVFTMSITGVLLTYERQILAWSAQTHYVPVAEQDTPIPLTDLLALAKLENSEFSPSSIEISNDAGAPVNLRAGRSGGMSLNPYSGASMEQSSESLENFFRSMTSFHRWFSLTGESRNTARAITGASNLIFLFLVLSGMYLWLPKLWKWGIFKARLWFNKSYPNSKARDFNWHHVMGIWCALPLVVVIATATVFSYGWSSNLVYQVFGEEPPVRGPRDGAEGSARGPNKLPIIESLSYDELFASAKEQAIAQFGDWQKLSLTLPEATSQTAQFSIDLGNGGQPHLRHSFSLDKENGQLDSVSLFSDQTPGRQARSYVRFLHTGESLGIIGQTIAGLVSLAALFMVWTGFALSYRRLIQPLFAKRASH